MQREFTALQETSMFMVFSQVRNKILTWFVAATLSLPFNWEWSSPQTAMWFHSSSDCYHPVLHSIPDVECQVACSYRTLLKYMCSGFLCCICHLISLSSWPFLWFLICELAQVLLLSFVINFYSCNSHFSCYYPWARSVLKCVSQHVYCFYDAHWLRTAQ